MDDRDMAKFAAWTVFLAIVLLVVLLTPENKQQVPAPPPQSQTQK